MYGKKLLKSMARVFTSLHQDWHLKNKSLLQLQSSQVKHTPQDAINEFIIQKYESLGSHGSCRCQIHLCILACVTSSEFTYEAVIKFLPAHFPRIWCKCPQSNFNH